MRGSNSTPTRGSSRVRIPPAGSCSPASFRDAIAFESQRTGLFARSTHARQWERQGLPIDLAAGQQIRNVVFRLDAAPTISGVIRNQLNAVVAGVLVQAMRRGFNSRGNRIFTLVASTRTDDRGQYRLYWLDPGEYLIAVAPEAAPNQPPGRANGPTYFPGFAEFDDAKVVRVDFRDANGTDFRVVQHDLITVFGNTVSLTTGSGVAADITLIPSEESGGAARYQTRSVAPDGAFSIPGVASGTIFFPQELRPKLLRLGFWSVGQCPSIDCRFAEISIPGRNNRAGCAHYRCRDRSAPCTSCAFRNDVVAP